MPTRIRLTEAQLKMIVERVVEEGEEENGFDMADDGPFDSLDESVRPIKKIFSL